jgi:hypothetical protein
MSGSNSVTRFFAVVFFYFASCVRQTEELPVVVVAAILVHEVL